MTFSDSHIITEYIFEIMKHSKLKYICDHGKSICDHGMSPIYAANMNLRCSKRYTHIGRVKGDVIGSLKARCRGTYKSTVYQT